LKKILIIGASGFVGAHLYKYLSSFKEYELIGTYYTQNKKGLIFLDYSDKISFLETLKNVKPDIVIWSAGEKNLDRTENDISFDIKENLEPIKTIVAWQKRVNISNPHLLFLSSDYVFSGEKGNYTAKDIPDPQTKYGLSKYYSELEILRNSTNFCILRVGGIIGEGGKFFDWIYNEIKNHKSIELYLEYFSPTPIKTLCEGINLVIQQNLKGVFHISGNKRISKYIFGIQLKDCLGNSKSDLTEKIKSKNSNIEDRSLIRSKEFIRISDLKDFFNTLKP